MDAFLRKHDVDVGKTFAVLMFLSMVEKLYEWFFDLLFRHAFSLGVGIIILYFLPQACGTIGKQRASGHWGCSGWLWVSSDYSGKQEVRTLDDLRTALWHAGVPYYVYVSAVRPGGVS